MQRKEGFSFLLFGVFPPPRNMSEENGAGETREDRPVETISLLIVPPCSESERNNTKVRMSSKREHYAHKLKMCHCNNGEETKRSLLFRNYLPFVIVRKHIVGGEPHSLKSGIADKDRQHPGKMPQTPPHPNVFF